MSDTVSRTRTLSLVIAPDSYKGSIGADAAAAAIAEGWRSIRPDDTIQLLPQADGGEGTLDAIAAASPGSILRDAGEVTGPDGRRTRGLWLELPGVVGVVELASVSGLPLMKGLNPLVAQTIGLGEVITAALDSGSTRLIIGLGGSASTDGGAGALSALGVRLYDENRALLSPGGAALARLATVDRSELRPPPPDGVTLLTDVDAPLIGPEGAAAVFGPQKGATPDQAQKLNAALTRFSAVLGGDPTEPGCGAAGGTAFGFASAWNAEIRSGAAYVAELTGLDHALAGADVVITGEGRYDSTSFGGKVVGRTLAAAHRLGVPAIVIAGQVQQTGRPFPAHPLASLALTDLVDAPEHAINDPIPVLMEAGRKAGRLATQEIGNRPQRSGRAARLSQ